MAVSSEMDLAHNHDIIDNGYNLGRDWLVGNLTNQANLVPTLVTNSNGTTYSGVTNQTTFTGEKSWSNYTYQTEVSYVSGLLRNSSGT
jgi:hypothetical protein